MNECENIKTALRSFSAERDWDQFHNGKDLSLALSIEAAELLEAFLWKQPENVAPETFEKNSPTCSFTPS